MDMVEQINSYIKAVKQNIANYMLIEDLAERERSIGAANVMLKEFEKVLQDLQTVG